MLSKIYFKINSLFTLLEIPKIGPYFFHIFSLSECTKIFFFGKFMPCNV